MPWQQGTMTCYRLCILVLCCSCALAANLDIPVSETTGQNNCSGASQGQVFRNSCFLDQRYGYRTVQYRPGDFCATYKVTCDAATGTVICSLFNSGFDVAAFERAPAQVPRASIGNCSGELTCSFSGSYPAPAGTSIPYIGLYKTQFANDRRLNFTIGRLTGTTMQRMRALEPLDFSLDRSCRANYSDRWITRWRVTIYIYI